MPHWEWLALTYGGTRSVPLWVGVLLAVVLAAVVVVILVFLLT